MLRLLLLLAACDAGTPPVPVRAARDAGTRDAIATPVKTDPFDALFALPAAQVTRDGRFVLLAIVDDDGARGAPNLAFELRDRKDSMVQRVNVLAIDEELDAPTKAARVGSVQAVLAAHDFVPMIALAGDRDEGLFSGAGVSVSWGSEHFTIARDGKRVVGRAVPAAWRHRRYYLKGAGLWCENPDLLAGGWAAADAEAKLVVVDVAYHGNDTCWEPSSQLHVISW